MESLGGSQVARRVRASPPPGSAMDAARSPSPARHQAPAIASVSESRPSSPMVPIATGMRASIGALPGHHMLVEVVPSPKAEPTFALSAAEDTARSPQRRRASYDAEQQPRPQTAPAAGSSSPPRLRPMSASPAPAAMQHGRVNLYEQEHMVPGPKVLRDYQRSMCSPYKSPDQFLRRGDGRDLRYRTNLTQWLKRHPRREPNLPFGDAGVRLRWESVPSSPSLFRYLYDNGTVDFVRVVSGNGMHNYVEFGQRARRGAMRWSREPADVAVAQWLPIFMEGIREYQEPYRFLAIKGSEALILEGGAALHQAAANCVPPLRKALESREPTAVAVALELMLLALKVDPKVAEVWIHQLWLFAQVMNLFVQRKFSVNLGYNTREFASVKQLVFDVLILMEENGGEHATALLRRYCRVDPAVTAVSLARTAAKHKDAPKWKPFTLF